MNRKWSVEDEQVKTALEGVVRSGIGSFYKVVDGRCVTFRAGQALRELGMCGTTAGRLLAKFPLPVIPFIHNRNRTATEEQLMARQEKKAKQALAKAMKMEAIAKRDISTVAIPVVEPVSISDGLRGDSSKAVTPVAVSIVPSATQTEEPEIEPAEDTLDKNHCLVKRGAWFGIYNLREGGEPRLISKNRDEAIAVLLAYSHEREYCNWAVIRSRDEE
jgi:hypothetical protein